MKILVYKKISRKRKIYNLYKIKFIKCDLKEKNNLNEMAFHRFTYNVFNVYHRKQ